MSSSEWEIAIHEAAHAEVAAHIGWTIHSVSITPPYVQASPGPRATRRQHMAYYSAGQLAEQILSSHATDTAFDTSLELFFQQLGNEDVDSVRAHGIAASVPEDDVHELARVIASYSTRQRGFAQFRAARSTALTILTERWAAVEDRARQALNRSS